MSAAAKQSFTPFSARLTDSLDQISRTIDENAKMVDLLQGVALELTTSANNLYSLTGKYVGMGSSVVEVLLPILRGLPLVPKEVMNTMNNLDGLTRKIVGTQAATAKTLADVQSSLSLGDVAKLQVHAAELQQLSKTLASILPK